MEIKSKEIVLVKIENIFPNEKNPNIHTEEQIERLCKLIKATGFRSPLIISNQSQKLVVGHGRLEAAKELGLKELPCIYEDFGNDADEYAFMCADNAIASWASLDFGKINIDFTELGPFDIELLGLKDFKVEPMEKLDIDELNKEETFILEATFFNETDLRACYNDMLSKGIIVKVKK